MNQHRKRIDQLLFQQAHVKIRVEEESKALAEARKRIDFTLQAQKIVQEVAEAIQNQAHRQIASVVSRCLETVFEDNAYEFQINFEQKRGRTEAELVFIRDRLEIDPTEAAGGGVVDVAAFALRLACLMLSIPRRRKLLLLDEPFRFLSKEYRPKIRELLIELAKELKMQMVIVTHDPMLQIGKVVEIS